VRAGGAWRVRYVPLGEGNVQLLQFAAILKEINFSRPVEIQAEYANGDAENAQDKPTLPREQVLADTNQGGQRARQLSLSPRVKWLSPARAPPYSPGRCVFIGCALMASPTGASTTCS
jgi:hypothetical protein